MSIYCTTLVASSHCLPCKSVLLASSCHNGNVQPFRPRNTTVSQHNKIVVAASAQRSDYHTNDRLRLAPVCILCAKTNFVYFLSIATQQASLPTKRCEQWEHWVSKGLALFLCQLLGDDLLSYGIWKPIWAGVSCCGSSMQDASVESGNSATVNTSVLFVNNTTKICRNSCYHLNLNKRYIPSS